MAKIDRITEKCREEKSISESVIWQATARFFQYGLGFLTTPIFTRVLTTGEYGQMSTFFTWVTLLGLVTGIQTRGSIPNARVKYSQEQYLKYISSIFSISLLSFGIILAIGMVFREFWGKLLVFESWLIPIMIIQSFVTYIVDFYVQKLRQDLNMRASSLILIALGASTSLLSVFLLLNMSRNKYLSKIMGTTMPYLIVSCVIVYFIYSKGKTFYHKEYWSYCLKLSIPIVGYSIASRIMTQSDRVMLRALISDSAAGVYSVVYTLSTIIELIRESIDQAWTPYYYRLSLEGKIGEIQHKESNYFLLYTIISIGFMFCAPEVFKIVAPEEYWGGLKMIPLITIAVYFTYLCSFPIKYEFYMEMTQVAMGATIVVAIVNVGLNYILIPIWQGIGAIIATVISSFFLLLIHDFAARKVVGNFDLPKKLYLKGSVPVFIMGVIYYFLLNSPVIRWTISVIIGLFLSIRIVRNKSIF